MFLVFSKQLLYDLFPQNIILKVQGALLMKNKENTISSWRKELSLSDIL